MNLQEQIHDARLLVLLGYSSSLPSEFLLCSVQFVGPYLLCVPNMSAFVLFILAYICSSLFSKSMNQSSEVIR
jgi:hypothetical protein